MTGRAVRGIGLGKVTAYRMGSGRDLKRVCVLTAGSVASTPRMVKAADALHEAGYQVRVVDADLTDWADVAGDELAAARPWPRRTVRWRRGGRGFFHWTRLRHHTARRLVVAVGPGRLPLGVLARAASRAAPELIRAAAAEPADLVYAGTTGGLAVAALAAGRLGVPFAVDLEDYHSGEHPDGDRANQLIEAVERRILSRAAFVTAGSGPIGDAVGRKYGVRPVPVNNTFPLPATPPEFGRRAGDPLRLFWFSQTIGPGRGLEDVIAAAGRLGFPVRVGLLGQAAGADPLVRAATAFPNVRLDLLPPCPPARIPDLCREWDVGLSTEIGTPRNRDLCLTNKLFTYLVAGRAVAASATTAQRQLLAELDGNAVLYRPGDPAELAAGLGRWATDSAALLRAMRASWDAAVRRWHWDHPLEKGALLAAAARAIGPP